MGASRDFTAGSRSATATLERPAARTSRTNQPRAYAPHAPRPRAVTPAQSAGRLGSRQVVSVRGRRVAESSEVKRKFSAVTAMAVPLLIVGVVVAMVLSGLSTTQSFAIQNLQERERQLAGEVESLNRDLGNLQSTSEIASKAAEANMVVPQVPGILAVGAQGEVREDRPFDPEATQKITDVTADQLTEPRDNRATSDRSATAQVGGNLTQLPGGNVLGGGAAPAPGNPAPANPDANAQAPLPEQQPNLAPYAPRVPAQQPVAPPAPDQVAR